MATPAEREGISLLCIWNGDGLMAKFFCYNQALFHTSGRVCECAPLKKSDFTIETETSISYEYPVLSIPIMRNKIHGHPAPVKIYPHRSKMLFDFQFSLAYSLIMNKSLDGDSEYLFPDYQKKVEDEADISKHFNYFCKKLEQLYRDYMGII